MGIVYFGFDVFFGSPVPSVSLAICSILELEAAILTVFCNILEFQPLILPSICNMLVLELFLSHVFLQVGFLKGGFRVCFRVGLVFSFC